MTRTRNKRTASLRERQKTRIARTPEARNGSLSIADIASDPQLEVRGFFQSVAGSRERFCGSFAVIDGERPALRHAPGEPGAFAPPRRRAGGPG